MKSMMFIFVMTMASLALAGNGTNTYESFHCESSSADPFGAETLLTIHGTKLTFSAKLDGKWIDVSADFAHIDSLDNVTYQVSLKNSGIFNRLILHNFEVSSAVMGLGQGRFEVVYSRPDEKTAALADYVCTPL